MTIKPPLGSYTYVTLCRKRVARARLLMGTAGAWSMAAEDADECADREARADGDPAWRDYHMSNAARKRARARVIEAQALRAWARLPPEVLAFCPTPDDGERIDLLWHLDCLLDDFAQQR
jgi:hypothetical protein